MANKKADDHFLRKAFDTIYQDVDRIQQVDPEDIKHQIKRASRVNRRVLGMSLIVIAVAVLLIVAVFGIQALFDYTAWVNRPSFAERLTAPYTLETKRPPYLLNAVTVDAEVEKLITFTTANIQPYKPNEQPPASQLLSEVVQLQSIVPAQMGDFTLQWDRTQSTLLAQCLLFTGAKEQGACETTYTAEFIEPANFIDSDGNKLSLVMTKFADNEQASATIDAVYDYARKIGRIGNFAFTDLLNVDYFYSATREVTSFTWLNENWVLSVSAENIDILDKFMENFPLYENNPNLSEWTVVQITQKPSSVPVAEETAESVDTSDAISGTE